MLTSTQLQQVGNFDTDTINNLAPCLGSQDSMTAAGAITLTTYETRIAVSGTMAFTLANAVTAGHRKRIVCESAASTPIGTVTITTPDATTGLVCPSTFVLNNAGQAIDLIWTGSAWRCLRTTRAGATVPVIGTTVLTGVNLNLNYSTSVTGTVSSTGTRALPNGAYPGDMCYVGCSVAASTPIGNINFAGLTLANVAATDIQAIGATTDTVTLQWTGTAWLVVANVGITIA